MNRSPEIFVTVPSYNHARFVEKCLRSIIGQNRVPKKLLVIDDGSRDGSLDVIERVLKDCPFDAELIARENRGLCATLNQALSVSSGKYFAYLGSDDYWLPDFLEFRTELLEAHDDAVLGYGHAYFVDENSEVYECSADCKADEVGYFDGDMRRMLLNMDVPVSSTVLYRRSALEHLSWNENAGLEDYEMYLKLVGLGDFAFDPRVLSVWRRHSANTSRDIAFMLDEVTDTQRRNLDVLRLTEPELAEIHVRTKFRYARQLLQNGHKLAAIRLARQSWRGAASGSQLAKFAARSLVPMAVVNYRRSRRKRSLQTTAAAALNQ